MTTIPRCDYHIHTKYLGCANACFALGSDAHDIGRLGTIRTAWEVAAELGLTADRIWRPPGDPVVGVAGDPALVADR